MFPKYSEIEVFVDTSLSLFYLTNVCREAGTSRMTQVLCASTVPTSMFLICSLLTGVQLGVVMFVFGLPVCRKNASMIHVNLPILHGIGFYDRTLYVTQTSSKYLFECLSFVLVVWILIYIISWKINYYEWLKVID